MPKLLTLLGLTVLVFSLTSCDQLGPWDLSDADVASGFSVVSDWRVAGDRIEPIWTRTPFTRQIVRVVNDNPIFRAQIRPIESEDLMITQVRESEDGSLREIAWNKDLWLSTGGVPFLGASLQFPERMGFSLLSPISSDTPIAGTQWINIQTSGLLLDSRSGEVDLTLMQQGYYAHQANPERLTSIRVELDPEVLIVPIKIVVVGHEADADENSMGWRNTSFTLTENTFRKWIDGLSVERQSGPILTHGLTGRSERPVLMRELDPRPSWRGGDDPNEGRSGLFPLKLELDSIFAQCKIQFRLMEVEFFRATDDCQAMRECGIGQPACLTTRGPNNQEPLSDRFFHEGYINVFLTDEISNNQGFQCTYRSGNIGTAGITVNPLVRGAGVRGGMTLIGYRSLLDGGVSYPTNILAHEIGHVLDSGGHFSDGRLPAPNLMSNSAPVLTSDQCASARSSILSGRFDHL
jgi:hypothetical protein